MAKVAILTPYARPIPGGISTFVSGLSRVLKDHNHEVFVLAGEGAGDTAEHSQMGRGRRYVRNAYRGLSETRPDVIHCHSHWYTLAAAARYSRGGVHPRTIFSFHTTAVPRARGLFSRLLRAADIITFVSAAQLAELRAALRLGGEFRILRPATNLAQPSEIQQQRWRSELGLAEAFPILAFAGPLEYRGKVEGVLDLVLAVHQVRARYPNTRLMIVGDGGLRHRVERAARELGNIVTITGFVADPGPLLATAHIYCHISRKEGLPTAILEAMSLGLCVIASRTGGIPEVIDGQNGILVRDSPDEIAGVICDLAKDPDKRIRLGLQAKRTIEHDYTWSTRWPLISSVYGFGD